MSNEEGKRRAARAAMRFVEPGMIVGVGTGSTVAHFIDALAERRADIEATVSSSEQSTRLLKERGIPVREHTETVEVLGKFPLPVEVIPMARSLVARALVKFGGNPVWRDGVVTDNGNWILDVHGLRIADPLALESEINQIVGVVTVGLFAARRADVVLTGEDV